jgi:hypothetical protein
MPTLLSYAIADDLPDNASVLWRQLIALRSSERKQFFIGLGPVAVSPHLAGAIGSASSVEFLAPLRKRIKSRISTWRLGVFGLREVLMFSPPVQLDHNITCPRQFRDFVETVGALQFGEFSGYMLLPPAGAALARNIVLPLYQGADFAGFLPFFDFQSGDYDGWLTEREFRYVQFNHEISEFDELPISTFAEWLDLIVEDKLNR